MLINCIRVFTKIELTREGARNLGVVVRSLTLLLAIAFCDKTFAASAFCDSYQNIRFVTVEDTSFYKCSDFSRLDRLIGQLTNISPYSFPKLPLYGAVPPYSGIGEFNWREWSIFVSFFPTNAQEVEDTEKVFAHEFGHQIFEVRVAGTVPLLNQLIELRNRKLKFGEMFISVTRLQTSRPECSSGECEAITEILRATPPDVLDANKDFNDFVQKNEDEISRIRKITAPFHELYADTFSAVFYEKSAVEIKSFGMSHQACRTFSEDLPADFFSSDPHCSLSGIRKPLWEKWIKPRLGKKRELLNELANVFVAEMLPTLADPTLPIQDPRMAVRSLKRRLGLP